MPVRAHIFARLPLAEWRNLFSDLEATLIFTPGDPKFAPPSGLHSVTGPSIQGEMLRKLWNAAHAFSQLPD